MNLSWMVVLLAGCSSDSDHPKPSSSEVSSGSGGEGGRSGSHAQPPEAAAGSSAGSSAHDAGMQSADAGAAGQGMMDAATRTDAGEMPEAGADASAQADASVSVVADAGCPRETVACNRSCIPAGQSAGDCEALRVEEQVSALALAGDKLYVSQSSGIFEYDLSNQSYTQIGKGKISSSQELAVDGRSLVVTVNFGSTRQLLRYDLDMDRVATLVDGLKTAADNVSISGGTVFYTAGALFRVPLNGGSAEQLSAAGYRVRGYLVDGDSVFILSDALRRRSLKDGSEMVLQMTLPGEQLFADATHLYTNDAGMLRRVPRAGGDAELLAGPRINGMALTSSGSDVFFAVGNAEGVVTRVSLGDKPQSSTVFEGGWPMAAAVGDGKLYVGLYPSARGSGLVQIGLKP